MTSSTTPEQERAPLQSPLASGEGAQLGRRLREEAAHTNEDIGQFDIPMQDAQVRHMDQGIDDLVEQTPSFVFRDTFIDTLEQPSSVPHIPGIRGS